MPSKPHHPNLNENILAGLDELFESSPPGKLRRSLQTLLFQFLRGIHNLEGDELHTTLSDVYYLMEFLDRAEGYER